MKYMNLKRVASAVLAGATALSMAVPAFAAGNTTTITGDYKEITLAVTVPNTGSASINPYGLPFKMGEATVSGQQIATKAPLVVANKSEVALTVSVNTKGTKAGGLTIVDAVPAENTAAKEAQIFFQIFAARGVSGDSVSDMDTLNPKFAALKDADAVGSVKVLDASVAANKDGTNGDDLMVLKAADSEGAVKDGGAAFIRLSGKVTKKPTTAWDTKDGFTASIVFTFEPAAPVTLTGALTAPTILADGGNADVTLTTTGLPAGVTVDEWKWESSNTDEVTVTADEDDSTTANVVDVANGDGGAVTITVTGEGSNGVTYTASCTYTAKDS